MFEKLKSRKFWATFLGSVVVLFANHLGLELSPDQLGSLAAIVGAYVLGQGYADGKQAALPEAK